MKKTKKSLIILAFLALLAASTISIAQCSVTNAESRGLAFIQAVLPFDSSQYDTTLKSYNVMDTPSTNLDSSSLGVGANLTQNNAGAEFITYNLKSKQSSIDIICELKDSDLISCFAYANGASPITNAIYSNTVDSAKDLLVKYQAYSGRDSSEMINMLSNIQSVNNNTLVRGNLNLTITHKDTKSAFFGDMVDFHWTTTINGASYQSVDLAFSNGVFYDLIDQRPLYSIGDTAINVSKDQAINSAMEYLKSYSYKTSDGSYASNFEVNETRTFTQLLSTTNGSNVLYPYWSVQLYLTKTYPGSIYGFHINIWAGTGQIWGIYKQGSGGLDTTPTQIQATATSSIATTDNDASSNTIILISAITVIAVLFVSVALFIKFRKR
jgi:hypothetical protein